MAGFTSGERRGLIVLIAILACLTLFLLLSRRFAYKEVEIATADAELRIESVADSIVPAASAQDSAAGRVKKARKVKSRRVATPPPPRNPLDETLNLSIKFEG